MARASLQYIQIFAVTSEPSSGHGASGRLRSVRRVKYSVYPERISTAFMWPAGAPVIKGAKNRLFDLEGPAACDITSRMRRRARLGRKRAHALTQSVVQINTCVSEPDPGLCENTFPRSLIWFLQFFSVLFLCK